MSDLLEEADQYRHPDFDSDCEKLVVRLADRIEALEAVLRFMLTDPPAALDEPDTDAEIIQHYREVARAALAKDADK